MAETNSTNQVVINLYGSGVGGYAAAINQALTSANAPGWLQGKFVVIGATGDLIKVAIAVNGGDPEIIGRTAFEAIGSVLGGTVGGVVGGTAGGPP